jgi:hypothetical protein
MSDPLETVKNRIMHGYEHAAKQCFEDGQHSKGEEFRDLANALAQTISELEQLRKASKPIPLFEGDDISDLPKELLAELSVTKTETIEDQVFQIVKSAGGKSNIDTILVYLYRNYGEVQTRKYVQNKLWRMAQKEILWSVPGKKGWYTLEKPAEEEPNISTPEEDFDDVTSTPVGGLKLDDEIPF